MTESKTARKDRKAMPKELQKTDNQRQYYNINPPEKKKYWEI